MNTSGELAESKDPKPENDLSNTEMDSPTSGSPPSPPVSSSVSTEGEAPKQGANDPSNVASGSGAADGVPSSAPVSTNLNTPEDATKKVAIVKPRATGPRTERGKDRSKRNAFKHGIFCNIILLNKEPRKAFNSLLNTLRNDLGPEGQLEEILVEKLASLVWRYRRMLIAERAGIQRGATDSTHSGWDDFLRNDPSAEIFLKGEGPKNKKPGLMVGIDNPVILAKCVQQLQLLRNLVEKRGIEYKTDFKILETLYGNDPPIDRGRLVTHYSTLCFYEPIAVPEWALDQRAKKEGITREAVDAKEAKSAQEANEENRIRTLKVLDEEISKLKAHAELIEKVTTAEDEVAQLCRNVLNGPNLDRLLRYEASLERSFDRTLSQLERLQRMRLGQPVLPKLEVHHSLS